jgi:hypothetical protein
MRKTIVIANILILFILSFGYSQIARYNYFRIGLGYSNIMPQNRDNLQPSLDIDLKLNIVKYRIIECGISLSLFSSSAKEITEYQDYDINVNMYYYSAYVSEVFKVFNNRTFLLQSIGFTSFYYTHSGSRYNEMCFPLTYGILFGYEYKIKNKIGIGTSISYNFCSINKYFYHNQMIIDNDKYYANRLVCNLTISYSQ